jgi:hypothetical protein
MVFLKIIACAFSMGFCLMCISSLMGFLTGQIFDTSSVRFDEPLEWLQQKCVYFLFLWIFFCGICAILAAKLKDFGKLTDFFVNLFLPTAAVWILSPFLGMMIVALIVSDLHLATFYSSLLSALIFIVLFMIVVAEVLKQIYPPKS